MTSVDFKFELDIEPSTRIISLSDIHGDIDALIIALRDCAKVIESNSNLPNDITNARDPELDRLLNLDLSIKDNMLDFDEHCELNFKWIGGTTHVVLVGDTIDPIRKNQYGIIQTAQSSRGRNVNDVYPQVEIKILKFLNKLDRMAITVDGHVIKLIGNHELANFDHYSQLNYTYLYTHIHIHIYV